MPLPLFNPLLPHKLRAATWCGRDPQDVLAESGILLSRVGVRLCVQGLVHLGQHDLAQVEEPCGGGGSWRWGGRGWGSGDTGASPVLACRDLMSLSSSSWGMGLPRR